VTLDRLADIVAAGALDQTLVSIDEALADIPSVSVTEPEAGRIMHGNSVPWREPTASGSLLLRIHDPFGKLLALGKPVQGDIRPELVFS
jgi:tRNA U55 pseudouridine synthase TruB